MPEYANSTPFISVIIPSLNEEKFLPHLLENLTAQTSRNFEVIHVDGQSEDKTQPLAAQLGLRLPVFKQIISPVRNVSHQRNLGAKMATGQYLLFIDADTQLPPYFIEGLSYQLHKTPADMFTTWAHADSKKPGDKALVTIINLGLEAFNFFESPSAIGVLMGCSVKAFQKIGGFDEATKYGEDEDFVRTGYKKHLDFKIYREPRFIYSFRRFRKEGTLPTLQQMAAKRLKGIATPKEYVMGGHVFADDEIKPSLFEGVDRAIKEYTSKPRLQKLLKDLLTFEEIEQD